MKEYGAMNKIYTKTIVVSFITLLVSATAQARTLECSTKIEVGENFETKEVTTPCGACRQMILELSQISNTDIEIIMSTTNKDKIIKATINELLPLGFGPKNMGLDTSKYS
jgi:cytidine deaminase